jgi:transcriptional regulator with XRE-family HTH domain
MKAQELKSARLAKGWSEAQAASRLGMTQAYLNYLEHGKRRLTATLVRRAIAVYGLSPEALPVGEVFLPVPTDDQHLVDLLARLEYPGFSYLRPHTATKNPKEVLLT